MRAITRFTYDKVAFNQENRVHLVLGLHAPRTEWQTKRSRVCIVPVVDVSGSMGGQKLEYAQKSVRALIEQLQSDDYCGLVVFSTQATLLGKPRRMDSEGKVALTNLVLQLRAGGSTHFSGGFELALDTCKKLDLPSDTLVRIIMFTDGQANCGLTHRASLLELVQKNRGSVTVSAFGYGADADQELLADFSKEGAGNYAYIQEPAEALPAFGKELGGLLSTYARNVLITMTPGGLHRIDEVVSADKVSLDLPLQIRLPDILSEQEHNVVLAMTLAQQAAISVQPVTVCEVKVEFDVLAEGVWERQTQELRAKVEFVPENARQLAATPEVDTIVARAQLVKAQAEAERLAQVGQFGDAVKYLQNMAQHFTMRGHAGLGQQAVKLGSKMNSREAYTSSQGYLKSYSKGMTNATSVSWYDVDAARDLECLGVSLNNEAQEKMAAQFAADESPPPRLELSFVMTPADKSHK